MFIRSPSFEKRTELNDLRKNGPENTTPPPEDDKDVVETRTERASSKIFSSAQPVKIGAVELRKIFKSLQ